MVPAHTGSAGQVGLLSSVSRSRTEETTFLRAHFAHFFRALAQGASQQVRNPESNRYGKLAGLAARMGRGSAGLGRIVRIFDYTHSRNTSMPVDPIKLVADSVEIRTGSLSPPASICSCQSCQILRIRVLFPSLIQSLLPKTTRAATVRARSLPSSSGSSAMSPPRRDSSGASGAMGEGCRFS